MKDLIQFIKESKFSLETQLENLAWGVLDYFNQEGVKGWDENDMKQYVKGEKEPNYKHIVDEIIGTIESDSHQDKNTLEFLKNYDKNEEDINAIIMKAMKDYIKNLM